MNKEQRGWKTSAAGDGSVIQGKNDAQDLCSTSCANAKDPGSEKEVVVVHENEGPDPGPRTRTLK